MSITTPTPLDVDALIADASGTLLPSLLADDVTWTEVDQRSQPRSPAVYRGRDTVLAMLAEARARGITSRVVDGFASGDRAALAVVCRYPGGGEVRGNALLRIRDGAVVDWSAVQAWDE